MKKLFTITTLVACTFALSAGMFAAEAKAKAGTAEAAKSSAEKVAGEGKAIPMYSRADAIDLKAKTFTNTRKDGTAVKMVITDSTEIMNAGAPAKLGDIKVGDYVSGLRKKVSETEYTVVKITKFGPKAPKKEGKAAAKPAEKK